MLAATTAKLLFFSRPRPVQEHQRLARHSVGDLLLKSVAERLKAWGRAQDTIARLGGDEFLVVVNNIKHITDAAVAAQRLMDGLTAEMVIQGHSLSVSCSLGISIYPEHGADSEALIKHADAAMYTAKDSGRNNFQFFTADMNAQAVERLNLENNLRTALDKKELFLMYQPQMDIKSRKIVGVEALLRWQHPEMGLVPPDEFIRIAESSGLIVSIGEWVPGRRARRPENGKMRGWPQCPWQSMCRRSNFVERASLNWFGRCYSILASPRNTSNWK